MLRVGISFVSLRLGLEDSAVDGISMPDWDYSGPWNALSDNRLTRKPNHRPQQSFLMGHVEIFAVEFIRERATVMTRALHGVE
jgi:hypothetical protein